MDIRELWEEGYIPAALVVLVLLAFVGLYFVFRANNWNLIWYWIGIGGLAVGAVAGAISSRMR